MVMYEASSLYSCGFLYCLLVWARMLLSCEGMSAYHLWSIHAKNLFLYCCLVIPRLNNINQQYFILLLEWSECDHACLPSALSRSRRPLRALVILIHYSSVCACTCLHYSSVCACACACACACTRAGTCTCACAEGSSCVYVCGIQHWGHIRVGYQGGECSHMHSYGQWEIQRYHTIM